MSLIACSSNCGTCVNSADFCLSCKSGQFASLGTCVSSCPSNMFSDSGKCTQCHPDCATCSGASFNQCLSCPSNNPILTTAKRCVTTCAKTEYFDSSSGTCKSCDSSCGSCSGGGSTSCLSCASSTQVLRAGKCTNVDCGNGQGPTSGLGICLAEIVQVPGNSGSPPVSIPPVDPNASQPIPHGHKLTWWQILLIVLGVLLVLIIILILWRRRQRKKRAQQTEQFKQNMEKKGLWGRLWRNPFAAWWARRRSAALNRRSRSDVERMSDVKDWRTTAHSGTDAAFSPGLGSDRRTAVGVPKSIGRGSWVTTGVPASVMDESKTYRERDRGLGLGAIREGREWENDRYTERSNRSGSRRDYDDRRRYEESRRGESRYYGEEIEQHDDGRSERTRTERTYDPYQYPRPSSRQSDIEADLISMIRSEAPEPDRRYPHDDRDSRRQYSERSRSNYGRSERSGYGQERSYREDRSYRQDYPASVSTQSQARTYDRDRHYPSSSSHGPDTPSMYSQPTLPRAPPPVVIANPFDMEESSPPRDAVLSSRFSMSTAAASQHAPKVKRKEVPQSIPAMPQDPPRQLTDAEMYKMSKLFPDLLALVSPSKKTAINQPEGIKSPSRNPFRI